jgi:shikimate dehydrogenase
VLDLVYRPHETAWVRAARARGHRAADGLAMLIEQGALAFERWFGVEPDREAMWAAVGGRREPMADQTTAR